MCNFRECSLNFIFEISAFFIVLNIILSSPAFSATTCVTNAGEYKKIENNIPVILQKLPLMFTAEGQSVFFVDISAAVKILVDSNGRLKLQCMILTNKDLEVDENYIEKACYKNGVLSVDLQNGDSYELNVKGSVVKISGVSLQRAKVEREYKATVSRLYRAGGISEPVEAGVATTDVKKGTR